MPTRSEISYFGAGPAPLPTPVLEQGSQAFLNYQGTGLSLAEISHRSSLAEKIIHDAKSALAILLEMPDTHEILFLHGGGTGQFSAVVFNLVAVWVERRRRAAERELGAQGVEAREKVLERVRREVREELTLDYVVTGSWSLKASQEAALLLGPVGGKSRVNVAYDAREGNGGKFGRIGDEGKWKLTSGEGGAFAYYCDNETVDGVEFAGFPRCLERSGEVDQYGLAERLVVCDMSSNFVSRRVDVDKYDVIFGGAQKNIGITDITILIVRKSLLTTRPPDAFLHACGISSPPSILSWPIVAKNASLYNTMPIFSIYIAGLVLHSLLAVLPAVSPLASQGEIASRKSAMLYEALERFPDVYRFVADKEVRSRMNVCFRIKGGDAAAEKAFLEGAEKRGLLGLKGHRSVGGVRASCYNAVTLEGVEKLRDWVLSFAEVEEPGS